MVGGQRPCSLSSVLVIRLTRLRPVVRPACTCCPFCSDAHSRRFSVARPGLPYSRERTKACSDGLRRHGFRVRGWEYCRSDRDSYMTSLSLHLRGLLQSRAVGSYIIGDSDSQHFIIHFHLTLRSNTVLKPDPLQSQCGCTLVQTHRLHLPISETFPVDSETRPLIRRSLCF